MYTVGMEKKLGKNTFTLLIININHRITFIINGKSNAVFIQNKKKLNNPYLRHNNNISSSFFFSIFFSSPSSSLLPNAYTLLLHYYYCYYISFFFLALLLLPIDFVFLFTTYVHHHAIKSQVYPGVFFAIV